MLLAPIPKRRSARAIATVSALFALVLLLSARSAAAAPPNKEQCIDAHSRGQDAREAGKLALARELFLSCAQVACPQMIQADCARFGDDIGRLLPTVTFAARDYKMNDLPNTYVYFDDALMTTRLDDGRTYEVDPGRHTVRFVHEGTETTLHVVVNQGEKGRQLMAQFSGPPAPPTTPGHASAPPPAEPSRPVAPLVVAGVGLAAAITGGVLVGVGYGKVPSNCSTSTHECLAAPGDPAFDQAKSGMSLVNVGFTLGIAGAAVMVAGVIWYFANPPAVSRTAKLFTPWVGKSSGGLAVAGDF
jgi:hypothetical protein